MELAIDPNDLSFATALGKSSSPTNQATQNFVALLRKMILKLWTIPDEVQGLAIKFADKLFQESSHFLKFNIIDYGTYYQHVIYTNGSTGKDLHFW